MVKIFDEAGYTAAMHNQTCVVSRVAELPRGQRLVTHVGEKHEQQSWPKVSLMGCPNEIRIKIVERWKEWHRQQQPQHGSIEAQPKP